MCFLKNKKIWNHLYILGKQSKENHLSQINPKETRGSIFVYYYNKFANI